ncbi:DUF362 domain-containing protein [uncultured Draconibacterium sp.]|mgnify:CR=1 FL=1|uniref:DUF362 domain-containing protein n=1 Tax=uncultured Draconibacterium sp. TaxID=1573823 RepID=UPI0025F7CBFA|nr:DUF362 domain-containing protein [uncultured Draconibacterium sp.]
MNKNFISRRDFVKTTLAGTVALAANMYPFTNEAVVSIVRIKNGDVKLAVKEAIDLIGGPKEIFRNKKQVMLKPNLVAPMPECTTKPEVIKALAEIIKDEGKKVSIGEGSAAAPGFNVKDNIQYRTKKPEILDPMQDFVFEQLGYTKLANEMDIPLINLHTGKMVDIDVPNGLMYDKITVHHSITKADMLVSVPMMKTHSLATVTLGMKNLIGVYPGSVYYSVRSFLHDRAAERGSEGIAYEIIDMVRASKMGLTVIDASSAMEGNGPTDGELVDMNLIIAGTNPFATDLVGASVMGFEIAEIPTFKWAIKSGFTPASLSDIEVRGEAINDVRRNFKKPFVVPWQSINKFWGVEEL